MNSILLTQFTRLLDSTIAIGRIRQFVLDLAIRGRLVPQRPTDEAAAELLVRIRREKQLINAEEYLASDGEDVEQPFTVPSSWEWSTLAKVGILSPRNTAADALETAFVPMPLIPAAYGVTHQHEVRLWGEVKKGYTHFAEGDVALAKITPCFENGKSTVFRALPGGIGAGTTELHVVRPVFVVPEFVLLFLKSRHFIETGIPLMTGTAGQKRVPFDYFATAPFPLPPVEEQHRIVERATELMALCDQLEEAIGQRDRRRNVLVAAATNRITRPRGDSHEWRGDASFCVANLARLASKPDDVEAIRECILSLAVRGRLSTQDANEPPPAVDDREGLQTGVPGELDSLPENWRLVSLARAASQIVDCPHSTPRWTEHGKICVRTNQFRPGYLDLGESRFVSETTYRERIVRLTPEEDDVLYSREGGILGIACRVPPGVELCLGQRMMLIRAGNLVRPEYLELVLNSPVINDIAKAKTTGGAAPRVNVATVKAYPVPVPPRPEQDRIVRRAKELMELCDRLQAALATSESERSRLLEAALADMLLEAQPTDTGSFAVEAHRAELRSLSVQSHQA